MTALPSDQHALRVIGLTKRYGDVVAVDGISFSVAGREIFGILGPNGAGKTTTLEMIEGLRNPDSGEITVLGMDAISQKRAVKARIGVQLQAAALIQNLTVAETLDMFAGLYPRSVDQAMLLERFGLEEKAKALVGHLSGGQRQRLSVALGLINDPEIVFLDEPTTGLDPAARRSLWDLVLEISGEGRTVILTTHYMEEAEELCGRVAIMDRGRIIALDTPANLVRDLKSNKTVECVISGDADEAVFAALPAVQRVQQVDGQLLLATTEPTATIRGLLELEGSAGIKVDDVKVRTATLEDVFINLTGRRLRD
jgi:ABC-2 type transport system ATP-binding protein